MMCSVERSRVRAVVKGMVFLLLAVSLTGCDTSTKSDTDAVDELTCGIARDIAGAFNVTDTIARSQERVADLYSGYGEIASAAVRAGLREWSEGMTSGDYNQAAQGIDATSAACAAEGF